MQPGTVTLSAAMLERLADLVVDEGKWSATAMLFAFFGAGVAYRRALGRGLPLRGRILCAMNLFFGLLIGVLAFGHMLAVGVKDVRGTLEGARLALYPMGIMLAVPSWWLILHAWRGRADDGRWRTVTLWLNVGSGASLLVLGLHNLPIAAPAMLNIAYQFHRRSAVGWTIVGVHVAVNLTLLALMAVFALSGQSFEQFRNV